MSKKQRACAIYKIKTGECIKTIHFKLNIP